MTEQPTIHPDNTEEGQAALRKQRQEQEQKFRDSIAHLPLRKQRKILDKYRLAYPTPAPHQPQMALSRRERRKQAREAQKATKGCHVAMEAGSVIAMAAPDPVPDNTLPSGWRSWPLKDLRHLAQDKRVRVDGRRPSLCTKTELIEALENL